MRLMLDWLVAKHHMREKWRYVSMDCGAQCVLNSIGGRERTGILRRLGWCADNWGMMDVSLFAGCPTYKQSHSSFIRAYSTAAVSCFVKCVCSG